MINKRSIRASASILVILLLVIAVILTIGTVRHRQTAAKPVQPVKHAKQIPSDSFDKTRYSTTVATSPWVIVNKQHPLSPLDYAPIDLVEPNVPRAAPGTERSKMRAEAADALQKLFAAADAAGYKLSLQSGYRSYNYQVTLYNGYVSDVGQSEADKESARPGYSEHQTGWAVDISALSGTCTLQACFGDTPEGKWLDANVHTFGFLLRYPADKTAITGYEYEPWHFRYIGTNLSQELYKQHIQTLEEFFGSTGGTVYK